MADSSNKAVTFLLKLSNDPSKENAAIHYDTEYRNGEKRIPDFWRGPTFLLASYDYRSTYLLYAIGNANRVRAGIFGKNSSAIPESLSLY